MKARELWTHYVNISKQSRKHSGSQFLNRLISVWFDTRSVLKLKAKCQIVTYINSIHRLCIITSFFSSFFYCVYCSLSFSLCLSVPVIIKVTDLLCLPFRIQSSLIEKCLTIKTQNVLGLRDLSLSTSCTLCHS